MKKIAFFNAKGGTGKTTVCFNYGFYLANKKNKKVLLMDFDPQANLVYSFGKGNSSISGNNLDSMIVNYLKGRKIDLDDYIIKINDNISLIPSSNNISLVDEYVTDFLIEKSVDDNKKYKSHERNLLVRDMLLDVIKPWKFNYLLIDCAPSFSLLSTAALIYAENILVVLKAEPYSYVDIDYLNKIINNLNRKYKTNIKIAGVIVNAFEQRKTISKKTVEEINDKYGSNMKIFNQKLKFLSFYQSSISNGNQPVFDCFPSSEASKSILELFGEIDDISFSMIN
ncbi:MAG: ParA family protein [Candidatus Humimicrobiaceae bacterium]